MMKIAGCDGFECSRWVMHLGKNNFWNSDGNTWEEFNWEECLYEHADTRNRMMHKWSWMMNGMQCDWNWCSDHRKSEWMSLLSHSVGWTILWMSRNWVKMTCSNTLGRKATQVQNIVQPSREWSPRDVHNNADLLWPDIKPWWRLRKDLLEGLQVRDLSALKCKSQVQALQNLQSQLYCYSQLSK